jgi:hypothetical protein
MIMEPRSHFSGDQLEDMPVGLTAIAKKVAVVLGA